MSIYQPDILFDVWLMHDVLKKHICHEDVLIIFHVLRYFKWAVFSAVFLPDEAYSYFHGIWLEVLPYFVELNSKMTATIYFQLISP